MYYQIYDTKTGKTFITCPDYESAKSMLESLNNPQYYDINEPDYKIRPIDKADHPLKSRTSARLRFG